LWLNEHPTAKVSEEVLTPIQRHFADIVRCVAYCNFIIMKAVNGFLMTKRQVTLKDECGYIMLVNFVGHVFRTLFWLILSIRLDYSRVVHLRLCGVLWIARSVSHPR